MGGPNHFFTPFFPKIYPFFNELTFFWISMRGPCTPCGSATAYSCFPAGKMFDMLDPMIILSGFHDSMDQKYRISCADIHLFYYPYLKKKKLSNLIPNLV